jgi:DNA-binding GntR family transcriptional regulator
MLGRRSSSAVCAHLPVPELARINLEFARARTSQRALDLACRWHERLTSQSQNRRLLETISALRLGIRRYEMVYMADTRLLPESVAQHNAIIDDLKQHDIAAAMKGLEKNWRFGMEGTHQKDGRRICMCKEEALRDYREIV